MRLRIIDKNRDFYDYLQNVYRDDSVTFDRTDSFLLTKEMVCDRLYGVNVRSRWSSWRDNPNYFVLLQVCNTFWLLLLKVKRWKDGCVIAEHPIDYTVELLTSWKNYNKERKLISVDIVSFTPEVTRLFYSRTLIEESLHRLIQAININDFRVEDSINKTTIYKGDGTKDEKHIPILKACGIGSCIDPLGIYLSFDEYFSLEKSSSERTSSLGITDNEKIENHGFDIKTSFRGK